MLLDIKQVMSSLEKIRAVKCEKINNSWTLKSGSLIVNSHLDEANVNCRVEEEELVIYVAWGNVSEDDLLNGPPPLEMSDRLLEFFGIEDKDDVMRLTQILAYSDLTRLENDMKRWPSRTKQMRIRKKGESLDPLIVKDHGCAKLWTVLIC